MEERSSFVGPGLVYKSRRIPPRFGISRFSSKMLKAFIASFAVVSSGCAFAVLGHSGEIAAGPLSTTTIPLLLFLQHYDTNMKCVPCGAGAQGPHVWNDANGGDGVYGNPNDCPHCSCYCAPASIAMIASYRGAGPPRIFQDNIYDMGKQTNGEVLGNGTLETHGFGMFDGTGAWKAEVQASMSWAVGLFNQYDWSGINPNGPMTVQLLQQYIAGWTPVLWLDHGGFPKNQSPGNPPPSYRTDQGHAKVIAGYDDKNTVADTSDDLCLIYDPWPEYLDLSILPVNATLGPGNSFDPYWLPLKDVNLSDPADIYLADTFPAIPEFTTSLVPVLGLVVVTVAVWRSGRKSPRVK